MKEIHKIPISFLKKVDRKKEKYFKKIGIYTIQDLLFYFPIFYKKRGKLISIKEVQKNIEVILYGKILDNNIISGKRKIMVVQIGDSSGTINIKFFNFSDFTKKKLSVGKHILVCGKAIKERENYTIIHPRYRIREKKKKYLLNRHIPVYQRINGISQIYLRKIILQALKLLDNYDLREVIPKTIQKYKITLKESIKIVHSPNIKYSIRLLNKFSHPAQKRLIFEELLTYQLFIRVSKDNIKKLLSPKLKLKYELKNQVLSSLPYNLTKSQEKAIKEVEFDLTRKYPMMRLIQGDVGSGKTIVALFSAIQVISNKKQVAFMAPTEILAKQHFDNFRKWLNPFSITIGWIHGKQRESIKKIQIKNILSGKTLVVVGTHAIFQKKIKFRSLGLIIIDEQHRFGVFQRLMLLEKGKRKKLFPNQLIMTATPIPRTLAMTIYANLDISTLVEKPLGRIPVKTIVLPETKRKKLVLRIGEILQKSNKQAYWICNIINISKQINIKSITSTKKSLLMMLPKIKIGIIHGKMNFEDKRKIMENFRRKEIQLLISTTTIELGIDIPNANFIIIENSERFGLTQLHQLRGRIGRGNKGSFCIFLYKKPLSYKGKLKLEILKKWNNGFLISNKDLEIRGYGKIFGTQQTGKKLFKIADLYRDKHIMYNIKNVLETTQKCCQKRAHLLFKRWINEGHKFILV
ncbi:hypothetical protein AOQ88_00435 [Candidatus Riesia sp. GBBU]|nr:hypothetical protein AOQ88_00435 [Candidatus Riesia sp. GBBU]